MVLAMRNKDADDMRDIFKVEMKIITARLRGEEWRKEKIQREFFNLSLELLGLIVVSFINTKKMNVCVWAHRPSYITIFFQDAS